MTKPDLTLLDDVVASKVLEALKLASEALRARNVRHVVVGGLAVGANGHPRATRDVDFLVGDEAFEHHGKLVTLRSGLPFQVDGVAVDFLCPEPDEPFLEAALAAPPGSVIEAAPLIYMKLKASRMQDRADVVALIKSSLDIETCRSYLRTNAPSLLDRFDDLVAVATAERD
ncbi:MAG: hypothetical protein IT384_32245 [Deltaproteobacteria bacterium]|nr:hypothetical protein [Deltaproteobacteria bacterium]